MLIICMDPCYFVILNVGIVPSSNDLPFITESV